MDRESLHNDCGRIATPAREMRDSIGRRCDTGIPGLGYRGNSLKDRALLVVPLGHIDDRIAAWFYPDGKQNRTAADGAVLGKTLTRAGRRIDADVVLLSAIRARVGSIVFKRHRSPYVRETRIPDDGRSPGCRSGDSLFT